MEQRNFNFIRIPKDLEIVRPRIKNIPHDCFSTMRYLLIFAQHEIFEQRWHHGVDNILLDLFYCMLEIKWRNTYMDCIIIPLQMDLVKLNILEKRELSFQNVGSDRVWLVSFWLMELSSVQHIFPTYRGWNGHKCFIGVL